jgi:hypothetical protein
MYALDGHKRAKRRQGLVQTDISARVAVAVAVTVDNLTQETKPPQGMREEEEQQQQQQDGEAAGQGL